MLIFHNVENVIPEIENCKLYKSNYKIIQGVLVYPMTAHDMPVFLTSSPYKRFLRNYDILYTEEFIA